MDLLGLLSAPRNGLQRRLPHLMTCAPGDAASCWGRQSDRIHTVTLLLLHPCVCVFCDSLVWVMQEEVLSHSSRSRTGPDQGSTCAEGHLFPPVTVEKDGRRIGCTLKKQEAPSFYLHLPSQ